MNIDKESLLDFADGFQDKEEAREHLEELIEKLNGFEDAVELKRVVFLENKSDLNILNLGNHWVEEDVDIEDHFVEYLQDECNGERIEGTAFLINASFNKSDIEIELTLSQNLLNPDEQEIYVRSMAKPLGIATIEPLYEAGSSMPIRDFVCNKEDMDISMDL